MLILTPFDGIVNASQVDAGQFVSVGDPLVELVDKAHLILKLSVPQQYLGKLTIGLPVSFTTSSYPGETFSQVLSYISPTVNTQTGTVTVWANVDNTNLKLAPGLFVSATVEIGEQRLKTNCFSYYCDDNSISSSLYSCRIFFWYNWCVLQTICFCFIRLSTNFRLCCINTITDDVLKNA